MNRGYRFPINVAGECKLPLKQTLAVLIHWTLWWAHATMQGSHANTFDLPIVHFLSHALLMHSFHGLNVGK